MVVGMAAKSTIGVPPAGLKPGAYESQWSAHLRSGEVVSSNDTKGLAAGTTS